MFIDKVNLAFSDGNLLIIKRNKYGKITQQRELTTFEKEQLVAFYDYIKQYINLI